MGTLRKVQIFKEDWKDISFRELKAGDKFRMFDPPENSPVVDNSDNSEWIALSDAYLSHENVWSIQT